MDTPLRLLGLKRQMAFVGEIKEERLKGILVPLNPLVISALRKTLGRDYILNEDQTRANLDIAVIFLAIDMHLEKNRNIVVKTCKKVFKKEMLGELERVVVNIDEVLSAPKPRDYDILIRMNKSMPQFPILAIEDLQAFEAYSPTGFFPSFYGSCRLKSPSVTNGLSITSKLRTSQ